MISLAFHDSSAASANGYFYDRIIVLQQRLFGCGDASRYVHVELVLPSADMANAETWSSVPAEGVRFTHIDLTQAEWKVVPLAGVTDSEAIAIHAVCQSMTGRKYDRLGIVGMGLPPWMDYLHDAKDDFCSEGCVVAMQRGAGMFSGIKAWRISPADLFRLAS